MKLKQCPFCGSKKVGVCTGTVEAPDGKYTARHVQCDNCNAMGPDTRFDAFVAADYWNRRRYGRRARTRSERSTLNA